MSSREKTTETSHPPQLNLFADPNFRGLSDAGKRAAFRLLMRDTYDGRLPGLWFFAINGDVNQQQQTERRAELHSECVSGYWPSLRDFFAELQQTGWFELDAETSLCRVSFAPMYFPPKDKHDVYGWLYRWNDLPDCKLKTAHIASMRAACEYDKDLVDLFDQWIVQMPQSIE